VVVVIRYKTKATACRALTFIIRIFVNDTIAIAVCTSFDTITIAVWISFHLCVCVSSVARPTTFITGSVRLTPKSGRAAACSKSPLCARSGSGASLLGDEKAANRTSLHPVYLNTVAVDLSLFLAD
jgi:hypothetical protein